MQAKPKPNASQNTILRQKYTQFNKILTFQKPAKYIKNPKKNQKMAHKTTKYPKITKILACKKYTLK